MNKNVPVHCKCGWTGWRRPEKIKARECPACDGKVTRWRDFAKAEKELDKLRDRAGYYDPLEERLRVLDQPGYYVGTPGVDVTPLESAIAKTFDPVPRLPAAFIIPVTQGRDMLFRIPPHLHRRRRRRR